MKIKYSIWGMIPTILLVQLGGAIGGSNLLLAKILITLGVLSLLGQIVSMFNQFSE